MRYKDEALLNNMVAFVNEYCANKNKAPSVMTVADEFKVSKACAYKYLSQLVDDDRLARNDAEFVSKAYIKSMDTIQVPVLGRVPCGPLECIEAIGGEYVRLPKMLTGSGKFFILRASGDSMINAGINHGDIVLIKQTSEASEGDIVVALVENEVTLKRLKYNARKKQYYLHPENETMKDIYVSNLQIQGVAKKVLKDLA